MTKEEMVTKVTELMAGYYEEANDKNGNSKKKSRAYTDAVFEALKVGIKDTGRVVVNGFGTFESVKKDAHEGRNPMTGETIQIPAKNVPKVKFSSRFKEELNA